MIEGARIFLLDLNPSRDLGKELQGILESSFNFDIRLEEKPAGASAASCCSSERLSMISDFNPEVIFIILSQGQLKQLKTLIQSLRKEQSELPIIIVTECGKPETMIQFLKLSVSDFITPPLKAIDIIPRLWRLLERKHHGASLSQY
jgi:DNA-binding response OmpR family regulator